LKTKGRPRAAFAIALAAVTALAVAGVAFAADYQYHSNPWLLSWIPATCTTISPAPPRARASW